MWCVILTVKSKENSKAYQRLRDVWRPLQRRQFARIEHPEHVLLVDQHLGLPALGLRVDDGVPCYRATGTDSRRRGTVERIVGECLPMYRIS